MIMVICMKEKEMAFNFSFCAKPKHEYVDSGLWVELRCERLAREILNRKVKK